MSDVNKYQIGGTHYKNAKLPDHWDVVIALNWDYLTGNATKYLWRLGKKGNTDAAIQDVEKAIHYLSKKLEVMKTAREAELAGLSAISVKLTPLGEPTSGYVNQDR